jgi:cell filamentation protein
MYAATADPYCYRGTTVLKNRRGLRDAAALEAFETVMTAQASDEPLPKGRLSVAHYCAVHRHLFGAIYPWAGRYRKVRLSKGRSAFCYPENIAKQMRKLFSDLRKANYLRGLGIDGFSKAAARCLAELNAIHPFREGNGRTQLTFLILIARQAGFRLDLEKLHPTRFLAAMIKSFSGQEGPLQKELRQLVIVN